MRRKLPALVAAALAVLVLGGLALASRDRPAPAPKPFRADPSQQFGDDADLMRRLERKKLVETPR